MRILNLCHHRRCRLQQAEWVSGRDREGLRRSGEGRRRNQDQQAANREQWIVKVRMLDNRRRIALDSKRTAEEID